MNISTQDDQPPIYLLFPGHGSERPNMSLKIYTQIESFRKDVDHCLALVEAFSGFDLKTVLFPGNTPEKIARKQLSQTICAQPALFTIEYSLYKLLERWGLKPNAMLGHSVSEYVAACIAGVFPLETALEIICKRGQLVQGVPEGAMLAVSLEANEVLSYLNDRLDLGSTIGEKQCVVSGYPDAVYELNELLVQKGVECKQVKVTRAYHSRMLDPILDEFGSFVESRQLHAPQLPFISGITGHWIEKDEANTADYWVRQLRSPVRLYQGISTLADRKGCVYLEVGKGTMLSSLVRGHPKVDESNAFVSLLPASHQKADELIFIAENLSKLNEFGHSIDLSILKAFIQIPNPQKSKNPITESETAEPKNLALEDKIARLLCSTLGLEHMGRHENFLEAGGNSLMAMQVISRMKHELNLTISLRHFFDCLTIAGICKHLKASTIERTTTDQDKSHRQKPTATAVAVDSIHVSKSDKVCIQQTKQSSTDMKFSLFFFSGDEGANPNNRYDLVMNGATFADENGFDGIWIPERHFNPFGGLYPNPSVLGAAIAVKTNHIHIRGGSVVAPLHHPVRIAEEWSTLDNLSKGRIGISFGSGFHPKDFILAPEKFENRKEEMFKAIETIEKLWKGESITAASGVNGDFTVRLFPTPYAESLPTWLSTTRSHDTFIEAGTRGYNILTALLRLSIEELKERIDIYREAREKAGHSKSDGIVTLMLHTFIGPGMDYVRSIVEQPLKQYLRNHLEHTEAVSIEKADAPVKLSTEEEEQLLDHAFNRYFENNSLIGTEDSCIETIKSLKDAGVDEIACLVDFGVDEKAFHTGLKHLNMLRLNSGNLALTQRSL